MRKEIIIAILLGLIVGLVVTYGVYTANQAISKKQKPATANDAVLESTPSNEKKVELTLSISSPQDGIVVSEPDIKVAGATLPNALVIILTDNEEFIVEADDNGVFQQEITLVKGANTIEITASDLVTTSLTETIQLVYSTEVNALEEE